MDGWIVITNFEHNFGSPDINATSHAREQSSFPVGKSFCNGLGQCSLYLNFTSQELFRPVACKAATSLPFLFFSHNITAIAT